jgi:acylphosphatase
MNGIHLEIRGRVQGVGFRWFIRETALRLDLAGWVSNRADGNVELAAAGDAASLDKLEAAARKGPSGAVVEEVRSLPPLDPATLPKPFGILRRERW